MITSILEFFSNIQNPIIEKLLIQFFVAQALAHLLNAYYKHIKRIFIYKALVGIILAVTQVLIMLLPAKIGSVPIDISTILLLLSFGFFGYTQGFIVLGVTLVTHFLIGPPHMWFGLIPYAVASILPSLLKQYVMDVRKKNIRGALFVIGGFINSIFLMAVLLLNVEVRQNIWETLFILFIMFPAITYLNAIVMYDQRLQVYTLEKLAETEALQRASINAPHEMEIFVIDRDFNYLSFNDFHAKNLNRFFNGTARVGGNFLNEIPNTKVRARLEKMLARALTGEKFDVEVRLESIPGKYLHDFYAPIYNDQQEIIGVTVFSYEITERKKREENITYLSYHDKLTNLYNRRYFDDYVENMSKTSGDIVVVYADINGLKIINDMFSHNAGDELIITVSQHIKEAFSRIGVVCRTGGDEIISVIEKTSLADVKKMADNIKEKLLTKKIQGIEISVSFGVAATNAKRGLAETIVAAEDLMYKDKLDDILRHRSNIINILLDQTQVLKLDPIDDDFLLGLARKLGKALALSSGELHHLAEAVRLRDISSVTIPEAQFLSSCTRDKETCILIRRRLEIAYRMLISTEEYSVIANDVISMHENYDGSGFPRSLKGAEIPLKSRIVKILCAYGLLMYQGDRFKSMSPKEALSILKEKSGVLYDPHLLTIFAEVINGHPLKIK
ncbi:MAG: diguanylate cyclase [Bacilli bacterium]